MGKGAMARKIACDFDPDVLKLFDQYVAVAGMKAAAKTGGNRGGSASDKGHDVSIPAGAGAGLRRRQFPRRSR